MIGSAATHLCCPDCRLRFTPASATYLRACPDCGQALQAVSLEGAVGFRVFSLEDAPPSLPLAIAVALAIPRHDGARS